MPCRKKGEHTSLSRSLEVEDKRKAARQQEAGLPKGKVQAAAIVCFICLLLEGECTSLCAGNAQF